MSRHLIVNLDRNQYLDPAAFGELTLKDIYESYEASLLGLLLLLADSNGRGGGDLEADHPLIGSWAGERIAIVDEAVCFRDVREAQSDRSDLCVHALMAERGQDLSAEVFQILATAQNEDFAVASLNPQCRVPMTVQRQCGQAAALLTRPEGRSRPFLTTADVFGVLGAEVGLTPWSARTRLQAGIDRMVKALDAPLHPQVQSVEFRHGHKVDHRDQPVEGVIALRLEVSDSHGADPDDLRTVNVFLGRTGTTVQTFFKQLLGVTEFDRKDAPAMPSLTAKET